MSSTPNQPFLGTSDETSGSILHANFLADENSPDLSHERHKAKVSARESVHAHARASQVTFDPPLSLRLLSSSFTLAQVVFNNALDAEM